MFNQNYIFSIPLKLLDYNGLFAHNFGYQVFLFNRPLG